MTGRGGAPGGGAFVRLHHVQLSCPAGGEDAARGFWVDAMGFTEVPKPESLLPRGGLWFRAEPARDPADSDSDSDSDSDGDDGPGADGVAVHVGIDEPFVPATRAHPALLVTDTAALEALADRLRAHGREVRTDTLLPGYERFYTDDAHGNRIEVLSPRPA